MKLEKAFDDFLINVVNLNKSRINTLDARVLAVGTHLQGTEIFGDPFVEFLPQGSYAHRTIIKPVDSTRGFDADVLLHMEEVEGWSPKDYVENLYSTFRASGTYKDKVSRRTRCVMVNYAGDFHMDVVPMVTRAGLQYVTNRHSDEFQFTKPLEFTAWLAEKDRITGGHFVHIVRLLKYLRDYKVTFAIKSIILSTLLGERVESFDEINSPECYDDLPSALRFILGKLSDYLQTRESMPSIYDPAKTGEDFSRRWNKENYRVFRDKMKFYSEKIDAAYAETDEKKSLAMWQEVFGPDFVLPAVAKPVTASRSFVRPHDAPPSESFLEELGIAVQLDSRYFVQIDARVQPKPGFRPFGLRDQANRVGTGREIVFTIQRCNVPEPYRVKWKVRNTGPEAATRNCFRGEIKDDLGRRSKWEPTAFRGRHYVECYVIKNGVCLAEARQPVVIE